MGGFFDFAFHKSSGRGKRNQLHRNAPTNTLAWSVHFNQEEKQI